MTGLTLQELSADTALQANSLELLPGQEQFETPVTYENADAGLDHSKTWGRVITRGDEVLGFVRAYFDSSHPMKSCGVVCGESALLPAHRDKVWGVSPSSP